MYTQAMDTMAREATAPKTGSQRTLEPAELQHAL